MYVTSLTNRDGWSPHISAQGEDPSGLQTDLLQTRQGWKQLSASAASKWSLFGFRGAQSHGGLLLERSLPSWKLNSAGRQQVRRRRSLRGAESQRDADTRAPVSQVSAASIAQTLRRDCEGQSEAGTPPRLTPFPSGLLFFLLCLVHTQALV